MRNDFTAFEGALSFVSMAQYNALNARRGPIDRAKSWWRSACRPLYSSLLTGLIGFFLIWHPEAQAQFTTIPVPGGALVKMAADLQRPYIYAIQAPVTAGQKGNLLFINTTNDTIEKTLSIGTNPTDLTIHYGENRLYIASWQENATYVVDLTTQSLLPSLNLGADVYKINAGKPGRITTEEEDQWIAVNIVDTATGNVVGSMPWMEREGDGEMDPSRAFYYHCDNNSSEAYIHKKQIENDIVIEIAKSLNHGYGSRNLVLSPDGSILFWRGYVYDANLNEIGAFGEEIYATTLHGDLALGAPHVLNTRNGKIVYTWPFSSQIMAVSGDQQKVFLFNSASNQLAVVPMSTIAAVSGPGFNPIPADGAVISLPLPQVFWALQPQALGYQVYFGTNKDAVVSANIHSVSYLGPTSTNYFSLPSGIKTGVTYYWRVDSLGFSGITAGSVWSFTPSPLAVMPQSMTIRGAVGWPIPPQSLSIGAQSETPWNMVIDQPWLSTSATNGSTPSSVTIGFNTSNLKAGLHTNFITLTENGTSLPISVVLELFDLNPSKMVADPNRDYIYVLHPGSGSFSDAFLLFINTASGIAEKVIPIGINPTDMSINRFDDRLYVANWGHNQTRVVDLKTQMETAPLSLGTDVFKVNGGLPGRIVIEGADDRVMGNLIDTTIGASIARVAILQGDGECDPTGRYYYHGDSYGWDDLITKYDFQMGGFVSLNNTKSDMYYNEVRNIVMSLDGSRLFWKQTAYDTNLLALGSFGKEIYCCTTNGMIAFSDRYAFDSSSGQTIYTLPVVSINKVVDRQNRKLWFFNTNTHLIEGIAMSEILKPTIQNQPTNQDVYSGTDVVLSLDTTGLSPMSYFWFFKDSNFAITTNAQVTITNCQPSQAGTYSVVVSNAFGTVHSSNALLTVENAAPVIATQPSSVTRFENENATFTVEAVGSLPMSFQWLFNGTKIDLATNRVLNLADVHLAHDGTYAVVITNDFGWTISTNAWLNVWDISDGLNATNLAWSTSGDKPWFMESTITHDGVAALQSGAIAAGENSLVKTTVNGPGTLTFWWSASSMLDVNVLIFHVDGVEMDRISGSVPWGQKKYYLIPGTHSLTWTYSKHAPDNLSSDCGWLDQVSYVEGGTSPFFTLSPTNQAVSLGSDVAFNAMAVGTPPLNYQWYHNGIALSGETNASLAIHDFQAVQTGSYTVTVTNDYGSVASEPVQLDAVNVVVWGAGETKTGQSNNYGQSILPANICATSIAGGGFHSLALQPDGRVKAWGNNNTGQINVPATLTNASAISAGFYHSLALKNDGTVTAWGSSSYKATAVPTNATNVIAIAAGWYHNLALRSNGTVVAWGAGTSQGASPNFGQAMVPTNLTGVAAIAAGGYHSLALKKNGTVVAWGLNSSGQTDVPPGLSNVVAIAAGGSNSLALTADGAVVAWGDDSSGQSDIPGGLSEVVAIAAGAAHCMALQWDGTLAVWGLDDNGQSTVPSELANVTAISSGGYHCMAMVNFGPVTFLNRPYSQKAYLKDEVTFAPAFLGASPMSCQWLKNGTNLPGGNRASLTLPDVQWADAGLYQLVVSNIFGTARSAEAQLTVTDLTPFFDEQPISLTVFQNSSPTFEAAVSGYAPMAFQWQFNGTNIPWATNTAIVLTNVQFSNEGPYSLIVSNQYGITTSSNAFLNIIDLADALDATNLVWQNTGATPWFAQSTNTHDGIAAGAVGPLSRYNPMTLQTTVNGPGILSFWWADSMNATFTFKIDAVAKASWRQYNGSTWGNATFYLASGRHTLSWIATNTSSLAPYPPCMAYLDQVIFTPGGTPPSISTQPKSQTLGAGNNATFTVAAVGTPSMTYQWYSNLVSIPGATGTSYTISNVQSNHAASYSVVVTNDYGMATSANAILEVTPTAPTILTQTGNLQIMVGGQATFSAGAAGSNPLTYQWMFKDSPLPGETGPSLTRTNIQASDGGNYYLVVTNAFGKAQSTNALLQVYTLKDLAAAVDESEIIWTTTNSFWFPQTNTTHDGVSALQSGVISDTVPSTLQGVFTGPATLTFWWKVNCDSFWDNLAFSVNGTIQNAIAGTVDWQQAKCFVGTGTQKVSWDLYALHSFMGGGTAWLDQVEVTPGGTGAQIASLSSDIVTNAGNNVTFSVAATGTPPLFYQWTFSGTNLHGATNAAMALNNVQNGNAGIYTVVVTNEFGSATSSNMTLVVNGSAPVITQQPASLTGVINGGATFAVAAKGSSPFQYQWRFNDVEIPGATNSALALSSLQFTNAGTYNVRISNDLGTAISSNAILEVSTSMVLEYWDRFSQPYATPLGVNNVVAVAAGTSHTAALRNDGTILCWGRNSYGQTNVPPGLSNVVSINAGSDHTVALKSDGTVAAWGDNSYSQLAVPEGLSNVTAIAASGNNTFALQSDGTVVGWGDNAYGQLNIPLAMSNVVGISAGYCNGFALKTDGSVVQWGNGPVWQSNGITTQLNIVQGMSNITTLAAGRTTAWLLLDDGAVQSVGLSAFDWFGGIAAVSASGAYPLSAHDYALCLRNDGTLMTSDDYAYTPQVPNNLSNVVAFSAGYRHAVVLVNDGAPRVVRTFLNRTAYTGAKVVLRSGVAGAYPMRYQWQFNGTNLDAATNVTLVLSSVSLDSAGNYSCIAGNAFGSATNTAATLAVLRSASVFKGPSHLSDVGFAMQMGQLSGHGNIVIMASTNLVDWVPIFTNAPVTGSLLYCDPEATNQPFRFYKAVEQ
jgi:alpha-tubulin suppressor-like RCC1 family protein